MASAGESFESALYEVHLHHRLIVKSFVLLNNTYNINSIIELGIKFFLAGSVGGSVLQS